VQQQLVETVKLRCVVLFGVLIVLGIMSPSSVNAQERLAQTQLNEVTYSIAWSPDGELLAVANANGALVLDQNLGFVTDLQDHNENEVISVAWNPDGSQLATGGGENDSTVRIWDRDVATNSFTFNRSLATSRGSISLLAWSPDGEKLASLSMWSILSGIAANLNIWATTGNWDPQPKPEYVYVDLLYALKWSFDSQFLSFIARPECPPSVTSGTCAYEGQEGTVVIDVSSGSVAYVKRHVPVPLSLAWSSVDLRFATTSFTVVELYDGATGTYIKSLPEALVQLAWSPDGTKIAGGFGDVHILDVKSGANTLSIPFDEARSIQWSPDGSKLALANLDGNIQIWDVSLMSSPTPTPLPTETFAEVRYRFTGRNLQSELNLSDTLPASRNLNSEFLKSLS
jgi:WD40 repeat protein